jgi:hypothetical protein
LFTSVGRSICVFGIGLRCTIRASHPHRAFLVLTLALATLIADSREFGEMGWLRSQVTVHGCVGQRKTSEKRSRCVIGLYKSCSLEFVDLLRAVFEQVCSRVALRLSGESNSGLVVGVD